MRHYTLARVAAESRTATMVLHTRGDGPGRAWARELRPGDQLRLLGPGSSLSPGRVDIVLGDTTAAGLAMALLGRTAAADRRPPTADTTGPIVGAAEVDADDVAAAQALLPGLDVLVAGTQPGDALAGRLDEHCPAVTGVETARLAGHAQTCIRPRTVLRERGLPRRRTHTHAYWADGKTGL